MKIVEQIKWGKLKRFIWDERYKQTSGEIKSNPNEDDTREYCFAPDKIHFDSKQLKKIIELLERENKSTDNHSKAKSEVKG